MAQTVVSKFEDSRASGIQSKETGYLGSRHVNIGLTGLAEDQGKLT